MTSLLAVPTIVALRSKHVRDPAPAEEPVTRRPAPTVATATQPARIAVLRRPPARFIPSSVRRLGVERSSRAPAALEVRDGRPLSAPRLEGCGHELAGLPLRRDPH